MKDQKTIITDEQADRLLKDLNAGWNENDPFIDSYPDTEAYADDNPEAAQEDNTLSAGDGNAVQPISDKSRSVFTENDKPSPKKAASGHSPGHTLSVGNQHHILKLSFIALMILMMAWLLPSANVMNLKTGTIVSKDRNTFYQNSSGNLLSYALDDVHKTARVYVLEMGDIPTPVPDSSKFTKIEDEERKNYNGKPIDYYKDESIEVKCWKEKRRGNIFNFSEIWISHPSQLRRTLVDNVISKKHLDFPSNIFSKTNGVVGMTADYCAYRDYGIIVQYGNIVRDTSRSLLDTAIYDKNGNFSFCVDSDAFFESDIFKSGDVIHTFAFGPVLVNDYKVKQSYKLTSYICQEMDPYPRAAICQFDYDKHYLLCTVEKPGLTLTEFAEELEKCGVRFAYNLDGGQTATLIFNQTRFNKAAYGGERPVSDMLYFATAVPND